jgi:hypothetical protein
MDRPQSDCRRSRGTLIKRRKLLEISPVVALSSFYLRPAHAADRVRVGMLKPNIVTVIYWIAVKTGAFEKNGLTVAENPVPSGQTSAGIEQLLRGPWIFISAPAEKSPMSTRATLRPASQPPSR